MYFVRTKKKKSKKKEKYMNESWKAEKERYKRMK